MLSMRTCFAFQSNSYSSSKVYIRLTSQVRLFLKGLLTGRLVRALVKSSQWREHNTGLQKPNFNSNRKSNRLKIPEQAQKCRPAFTTGSCNTSSNRCAGGKENEKQNKELNTQSLKLIQTLKYCSNYTRMRKERASLICQAREHARPLAMHRPRKEKWSIWHHGRLADGSMRPITHA